MQRPEHLLEYHERAGERAHQPIYFKSGHSTQTQPDRSTPRKGKIQIEKKNKIVVLRVQNYIFTLSSLSVH